MSAKTILITGVTRGLGRAMAEEFIRLGHTVVGCGRSEKEITRLQKQFGAPNDFAVVNVADDPQVGIWAKRILSSHGQPDLVLNNAALINRSARLWEVPVQEFSDVIDVKELPSGMAAVPLNPGIIATDMLQSCFGGSASGYPRPEEWAKSAVPFLLKINSADNGKPMTAPG